MQIPKFFPFRLITVLVVFLCLVMQSCKTTESYNYYYYKLGKLECNNVTILEKRMRLVEQGKENTSEYDSLGKELDKSLTEYELFVEKHWSKDKEIAKQFTKEQILLEKQRGYEPCNCDTCYFKIKSKQ